MKSSGATATKKATTSTTDSTSTSGKKVNFEYYAPHAKKVEVAGSFNSWDYKKTILEKDSKGNWKTTITLKPGRYEYRYRVDGNWQNDQRPVECVPNAFGSWNCVVQVQP